MSDDQHVFDLNIFPDELCEKIMDSCDLKTMTALASTSRYWDHKRRECIYFRIVNLLEYFFLDPVSFRECLTRTSSIVSGSTALLVFFPGLFVPGDIDVYVPEKALSDVLDYFNTHTEYRSREDGLTVEGTTPAAQYTTWEAGDRYIAQVLKLYCDPPPTSNDMDPRAANIIVIKSAEPIIAIKHFHSTPVMNIITGKGIMCMYPELTYRMRGIVNTRRNTLDSSTKLKVCLDKYRERGFDLAMTLGKWPGLRSNLAKRALMRDMPACVVPFPEKMKGERVPKSVVLKRDEWYLTWEMSEWR